MSHVTGLEVLILGAAGLAQALVDTGLDCAVETKFQTEDGKTHAVDAVVTDPETGAKVGIVIDAKTGKSGYIAHDCKSGGTKGKALATKVQQAYARSRALEELRRKGYKVTKEDVSADGTIHVVAQKWK